MTPKLTDRPALTRHRTRARADALFLHAEVALEVQERLNEVNRTFTSPVVVTAFPDFWPGLPTVPDADLLDLAEGAHDLVIHALALHWADDPVGQIVQCRRALRPDGLFLAACFGGGTLRELRAALTAAEAEMTGGLSPRMLPMADIRDLGALLSRGGLALPVADTDRRTVRYRDALHLMRDLRGMGETSALNARPRHFTRSAVLLDAARRYQAEHADAEGRIPATFDLVWLTGWAPHPDQQKPLRPGSATHRLSDALRPGDQNV